jgi:hypothetical protein
MDYRPTLASSLIAESGQRLKELSYDKKDSKWWKEESLHGSDTRRWKGTHVLRQKGSEITGDRELWMSVYSGQLSFASHDSTVADLLKQKRPATARPALKCEAERVGSVFVSVNRSLRFCTSENMGYGVSD